MSLPPIEQITQLSDSEIQDALDNLFEPCQTLSSYLIPKIRNRSDFRTYADLIEYCRLQLHKLINEHKTSSKNADVGGIKEQICKIVSAHPRLGVPKKQISSLSAHSQNEQKSLNEGDESGTLAVKLRALNDEYERSFPGLIFVVFVNGRSREEIMEIMDHRISTSSWNDEVQIAFDSMCDIALDRARKLNSKL